MVIDIATRKPLVLEGEVDDGAPVNSAAQVLERLLLSAHTIGNLLVLTSDTDGVMACIGNLETPADINLFIDQVKLSLLMQTKEQPPSGGGAA